MINGRWLIGFFVCLCAVSNFVNPAEACRFDIRSITFVPETACPGEEIQVTVQVECSSMIWKSTKIDGDCTEHIGHGHSGIFTETFVIIAPDVPGIYPIEVVVYQRNECYAGWGGHLQSQTVNLTVICCCEDGFSCWDLNQNYLCDDDEDINFDQVCDVLDCHGGDGESCSVKQDAECAIITCAEETWAIICNGEDGVDGVDGTSCWIEQNSDGIVVHCGESQAVVLNGLNCWDINENHDPDFCSPYLQQMFDGECPSRFIVEYPCEDPVVPCTKASLVAKDYEGHVCEIEVTCVEYMMGEMLVDEDIANQICIFTEDTNGDGKIDMLDCQGSDGYNGVNGTNGTNGIDGRDGIDGIDGVDGSIGPQGESGIDGTDGKNGEDGENCEVIDNLDSTCTIVCGESEVLVYDCGVGVEHEATSVIATHGVSCGAFNGVAFLVFPFLCYWFKLRR